jgi:hypothetical protein
MLDRPADSNAVEAEAYLSSGPSGDTDISLVLHQLPVVTPEVATRFGAPPGGRVHDRGGSCAPHEPRPSVREQRLSGCRRNRWQPSPHGSRFCGHSAGHRGSARAPELPVCDGNEETAAAISEQWLIWIFLQPYAEYLADQRRPVCIDGTPSNCPVCGANPLVGVLRSEGNGARKSLVCMLCAHEWMFRRIYCPACGEERESQMAFYSAPEIVHVRVDVCDTCHTYLKSIDLTKTGLAVPVVDELATILLDLWAREHGYEKLQMNLLGT